MVIWFLLAYHLVSVCLAYVSICYMYVGKFGLLMSEINFLQFIHILLYDYHIVSCFFLFI